jgi:hypothetical protein
MYTSVQSRKVANLKLQPIPSNPSPEVQKSSQDRLSKLSIHSKFSKSKRRLEKLPSLPVPRLSDVSIKIQAEENSLTEKTVKREGTDSTFHEKNQKSNLKKSNVSQIASPKATSKNKLKTLHKVSYYQASNYPEWSIIAKPEIEKMWKNLFYDSNGLLPVKFKSGFKYFLGTGQVSTVVRKILASRTWWTETSVLEEANMIWGDKKEKQIFEVLPKVCSKNIEIDLESTTFVFQVPVKIDEEYRLVDLSDLGMGKIRNAESFLKLKASEYNPSLQKLYNKVEFSQFLTSKKKLMENLKFYTQANGKQVFSYCPPTFITKKDFLCTNSIKLFVKTFSDKSKKKAKNFWNVLNDKLPRHLQMIRMCKNFTEIQENLENFREGSTIVIEKHINNVYLVKDRKVILKYFVLFTFFNGITQVYLYEQGCAETYLVNSAKNDKKVKNLEEENKNIYDERKIMSFDEFSSSFNGKKSSFFDLINLKIKEIIKDTILANRENIASQKRLNCMEIVFYDFLIDAQMKPWLLDISPIETLDINCTFLDEILTKLIENTFRITLDCFFPQSTFTSKTFEPIVENNFHLLYHDSKQINKTV